MLKGACARVPFAAYSFEIQQLYLSAYELMAIPFLWLYVATGCISACFGAASLAPEWTRLTFERGRAAPMRICQLAFAWLIQGLETASMLAPILVKWPAVLMLLFILLPALGLSLAIKLAAVSIEFCMAWMARLLFCTRMCILYCIVLYCIVSYRIVSYRIVSYCIVLYCIVLYGIVLYCIVL